MSMIKCPECGHQISDKAPVCPNCGVEIAGKITKCPQCGEILFLKELKKGNFFYCAKCKFQKEAQ